MASTSTRSRLPRLRGWGMGCALALAHCAALAQQPVKVTPEQLKQLQPFVAQTLAAQAADDARLELAVDNLYGRDLSPDKRAVAKDAMRAVLVNERLPAYVLQSLAPVVTTMMNTIDLQPYVARSMWALQARGIRRLPTARKADYLKFTLNMAAAVPASTCKALFLGKLDAGLAVRLTQRYAATLPLAGFEEFSLVGKDSAEAELAGYPDVSTPTASQAASAQRAYVAAMSERLRRLPAGVNDRVLDNPETAEPAEACLWFRESAAAVLDLAEPYRGWQLTQVVGSP